MTDIPKDYLDRLKKGRTPLKITSERQELIQRFVDKINLERVGMKWKPVTARQLNVFVSFLPVRDLYWLYAKCEQASSFSKKFFGVLKDTRVHPPLPPPLPASPAGGLRGEDDGGVIRKLKS